MVSEIEISPPIEAGFSLPNLQQERDPMTAPVFGMQFSRPDDEPVPVTGADFSKVVIYDESDDASNSEFPYGDPIRGSTSDKDFREALGTGALADHVRGIHDQLSSLNLGADVTIVRVEKTLDEDDAPDKAAISADIVAALDDLTGVASIVNATPRLVICGYTDWRVNANTVNPVVAKLQTVLPKILAIAPVQVDATSAANAIDMREDMSSDRLMPIGIKAKVFEGQDVVIRDMTSRVAGLFIRTDNAHEGRPFHPIANQPVLGIAGLNRPLPFSFLDGSTQGQQMLEGDVSIVAQGESGVDGAVADGGFVFIGTDNASTGELWKQIHQVRGADYITVEFIQITRQFLGKLMSADLVEAWINSIAFKLRDHKVDGDILGYTPPEQMFKPDANSPENIRLGTLQLDIGIEPAPAFKLANHAIHRYRPAVVGLVDEIISRLSSAA
jgi:phage tail sheath protein FI